MEEEEDGGGGSTTTGGRGSPPFPSSRFFFLLLDLGDIIILCVCVFLHPDGGVERGMMMRDYDVRRVKALIATTKCVFCVFFCVYFLVGRSLCFCGLVWREGFH